MHTYYFLLNSQAAFLFVQKKTSKNLFGYVQRLDFLFSKFKLRFVQLVVVQKLQLLVVLLVVLLPLLLLHVASSCEYASESRTQQSKAMMEQ